MGRPAQRALLSVTIGLTVALAVYRFGPWPTTETLDGVRQFVRLAVVIAGVASIESVTERRRARRVARAVALIRESVSRRGPS